MIVWDAARRVEHFIRRARFDTAARDFGFLVPTPAQPTLAEASDELFTKLDEIARPEERTERARRIVPTVSCLCLVLTTAKRSEDTSPPSIMAASPVRVLSAQRVSGYDAVVLEAEDAEALTRWLSSHGYASTPSLTRWLRPYVEQRWKITAFRIAAPDPNNPAPPVTAPVRMTFSTDRPFYPYREPEEQQQVVGASRSLRVHVLSSERMQGTIGLAGRWPATVAFSDNPDDLAARIGALAGTTIAAGTWLTTFDDRSSPRPGTDELYFSPSSDRGRHLPPPIVRVHHEEVPIPVDWLAVPLFARWVWQRRKKRLAAEVAARNERESPP